jgi:uncharacterized protein
LLIIAEGPKLERLVRLNFQGDWGQANFHTVCSWLTQEVIDRCAPGSRVAIWNGVGGADAARAVGSREVDLAISTPAVLARLALEGRGLHEGKPVRELRAIGVLPQDDRLIVGIRREHGIRTFAELRERKPKLRIAVSVDDGRNQIGYVTQRLMTVSGIGRSVIEGWGGELYEAERPDSCLDLLHAGRVDAIIQEAIMTPWWHEHRKIPLNFLSIEDEVLERLEAQVGLRRNVLPKGYFPDLDHELAALDFSDFVVLVHSDMPEDLAHLITWCFTETRERLEQRYRHMPPHRAPLGYPLIPQRMAASPIPLHTGAERLYRELGYLTG